MALPNSPDRPASQQVPAQHITLASGLVLDARRAVFLPNRRILAVADLHLGYAWVQRRRGALLPVDIPDDTADRLVELQRAYSPQQTVILGDIVHQALPLPAIRAAIRDLCHRLAGTGDLIFCLGNHDRQLEALIDSEKLPVQLVNEWLTEGWLWHHGDRSGEDDTLRLDAGDPIRVMGHEHPCVRLSDRNSSTVKTPCFLVSDRLVILPAFSRWAAGCTIGQHPFMSPQARETTFPWVYACMGTRILRIPWSMAVHRTLP